MQCSGSHVFPSGPYKNMFKIQMSHLHSRWPQWQFPPPVHCNIQGNAWNQNYILTVVLAPGFHSWLAQFVWSHLVSSASHSSGRNQMESVTAPSPLASHAPEGCSALSYHPHCSQEKQNFLKCVSKNSCPHKIIAGMTSCKFLYYFSIREMCFLHNMWYSYATLSLQCGLFTTKLG